MHVHATETNFQPYCNYYTCVGKLADGSYPREFYRFNFADERFAPPVSLFLCVLLRKILFCSFSQLAPFAGAGRAHPAMVIMVDPATGNDDKVLVGCGGNNGGNLKDWYEYDIGTDTWTQLPDLPGLARHRPYQSPPLFALCLFPSA